MATYILFWNPAISSYTMDRFKDDFNFRECVGNWSFHEHEDVEEGDYFYMVRCGEGRIGIVMHGVITSECYEDEDWSPKNRKPIFYADIQDDITIDPESAEVMLTPELLTKEMPDFNWYGGHSGRKLSEDMAARLDEIWLDYINSNSEMLVNGQANICEFDGPFLSPVMKEKLDRVAPHHCEICGYDYDKAFGRELAERENLEVPFCYVPDKNLPRIFFRVCPSCQKVEPRFIYDIIESKFGNKE